ncbi:MAG: cytochrome P450 [Chloroflexi bacterium]|nr:cytochrome P450 [Chloroflexota bacterium]MCI0856670.1 cytochrome P450 [Chloroflexota bacterium]
MKVPSVQYNPLLPEVRENPYPYYAELRRDHPVYPLGEQGAVVVSRYEDVAFVLRSHEHFSSGAMGSLAGSGEMLIGSDPPGHTRLRSLVNRAFTPAMVAALEPRIREVAAELLDRAGSRGEMDLVSELANPLPVTIIAEILGVDSALRDDFKRWSHSTVSGSAGSQASDDERARAAKDRQEFSDYFLQAIEERRREPRDDLISALVRAEDEEHALTADEVLAFTQLLLIAGNETTTNLIGNMVLALLEHPEQLQRVLDDRSLIPNTVEEALRYDSPVQFLFRTAAHDVELAGTAIKQGTVVLPLYASANRDERKFPDPDRFDVTRNAQGHLAFGYGIHFCLGAPLARLEAKVALEELLARFPRLSRKSDAVDRLDSFFLRGLKELPLTIGAENQSTD